jgi:hypothetical protein
MRSRIRNVAVSVAIVAGVCGGFASAVGAAQPVVQACVGTTFSGAAAALPPGGVGQAVVGFAQDPGSRPGIGDGIQALQAGLVSEDVVPNTCN